MTKNKIYAANINCSNDIEELRALVTLYVMSVALRDKSRKLRPKATDLLSFYVRDGYSITTKKLAASVLETTMSNINVMNLELTKTGYLITSDKNHHNKNLNPELQALASYINSGSKEKLFVFKINNF